MTPEEKIDYMIQSLKIAKDEISYAKHYKFSRSVDYDRNPNGTIIRESLKQVGRMANIVANDITLTPYCSQLFKGD